MIPFGASYRPLWMGFGALSFDILIALVITSLVRRRLGYRAWRGVHWLAYASWPVAVLHGLGTGSDTKVWWMLALTAGCLAAVLIAIWFRIARAEPERRGLRGTAIAITLATPLGLAIFTLAGPLQRGWARRAGTPPSLLGSTFVPAAATVRHGVRGQRHQPRRPRHPGQPARSRCRSRPGSQARSRKRPNLEERSWTSRCA